MELLVRFIVFVLTVYLLILYNEHVFFANIKKVNKS